jgi:hypothetical protein
MTSWAELRAEVPEFAEKVRLLFDAGTNKTLASLRRDGSPRISGTEVRIEDGQVSLGMMPASMKLADVRRDPRVAIHSPTLEPPEGDPRAWPGDAKLSGRLVEIPSPEASPVAGAAYFALDVTEAVVTYVADTGDQLVIETWDTRHGYRRRTRA